MEEKLKKEKFVKLRERIDGEFTWFDFSNDDTAWELKDIECKECLNYFYDQLHEGVKEIDLKYSLDCWKVLVPLKNQDDCWGLFGRLCSTYKEPYVGKFGRKHDLPYALFYLYVGKNRIKEWKTKLNYLVKSFKKVEPSFSIEHRRGCEIFEDLLGPWYDWKRKTPVKYPEKVKEVKDFLERVYFGRL